MKQDIFQFSHTDRNSQSALLVVKELEPFFKSSNSILDLGGGVGAWSKALMDVGLENIHLVDHPSIKVDDLIIEDKSKFSGIDLEVDFPKPEIYDCILCIEVLEHFEESRALEIHQFICQHSDLVLFSAAIPGQNGVGHINCQRHAYWHQQFKSQGFDFYDGFKSKLLNNKDIQYWIRQNLFFYYRPEKINLFQGLPNLTNTEYELVHESILNRKIGIREYLKMAPGIFFK